MTTCAYNRNTKTIGVDSRNTDDSGSVFMMNKIELLTDGRFFLGSGHCLTINAAKQWADSNYAEHKRPEAFALLRGEDREDYGMSCLIISKDGEEIILLDSEETPTEILDDIVAVGSGGAYARGALAAGAKMEEAIDIAIRYDGNSGGPVRTHKIK